MSGRPDQPDPLAPPTGPRRVEFSEATRLLREVLLASEDVEQHLVEEFRVGPNDVAALQHLMIGGPMGPAELARRIHITSASATVLVDRLEVAGHVERRPDPGDRRRRTVVPTLQTAQRIHRAILPLIEAVDGVLDAFGDEEQAVVERYLRAVLDAYGGYLSSEI